MRAMKCRTFLYVIAGQIPGINLVVARMCVCDMQEREGGGRVGENGKEEGRERLPNNVQLGCVRWVRWAGPCGGKFETFYFECRNSEPLGLGGGVFTLLLPPLMSCT